MKSTQQDGFHMALGKPELSYKKTKYDHVVHLIQAVFILRQNYQNYSLVNLHLNYVQWRDSGTASTEQSTRALSLSCLVSLPGGRDPGRSVALVSQDHLTGLDVLKIIFRTVPEGFLLLHMKGQPH